VVSSNNCQFRGASVSATRGTVDGGALGVGLATAGALGEGVGAGAVATVEGAPHAMTATAASKMRENCMDDPVLRAQ
jgi:hypothetical protein